MLRNPSLIRSRFFNFSVTGPSHQTSRPQRSCIRAAKNEKSGARLDQACAWFSGSPIAEKHYSGEFRVRIPPELHRALAMQAAGQGVSLNRLASAKLAA